MNMQTYLLPGPAVFGVKLCRRIRFGFTFDFVEKAQPAGHVG